MVNLELASYIKDQIKAGYDIKTVRDYLVKRGRSAREVDAAVDSIFGEKEASPGKTHTEVSVIVGLFFLILLFISMMYFAVVKLNIQSAPSRSVFESEGQMSLSTEMVCSSIVEDELKYECYASLFRNNFLCESIDLVLERSFCYRAKDIYVLSA